MRTRYLALLFVLFAWLAAAVFWPAGVRTRAQTQPPPEMPPMPQGLDPPPTVYPPTEVYFGSYWYYQVCMACHGDQGQGLTDEWRAQLDEPDQNCWQSKCHHSNHPPGGFVFPTYVPPVKGPIMLARFETALDLHDYIRDNMPYQAPGSRSDEEYWQITAFLVSLNGANPGDGPLNRERAAAIYLDPSRRPASPSNAAPAASPPSVVSPAVHPPAVEPQSAEPSARTRSYGRIAALGLLLAAGAAIALIFKPFKIRSL